MNVKQIEELAGHRQVSPWIIKLVQDAVMIEREACAKVCEDYAEHLGQDAQYWDTAALNCSDAIRARNLDDLTSESQLRGEYE